MLYARRVGLAEDVAYLLNPPFSQATKSYPGKAKSYESKALNETMLPMKSQHGTTPTPIPISTKKNEDGVF